MKNPLDLEFTDNFDSLYWSYNLPLQLWPNHENPNDENSDIIKWRVLNYMPRKEVCRDLGGYLYPEEMPAFCRNAAKILRNLADLFEKMASGETNTIYYPDETIKEAQP